MDEEEQFVNIDLNDDNICSVCKLETETGTLSFCHVCFELSIEGKREKKCSLLDAWFNPWKDVYSFTHTECVLHGLLCCLIKMHKYERFLFRDRLIRLINY